MTIALNGAGNNALDPVLNALPMAALLIPASIDVDQINAIGLDQVTGFPISNSIAGSVTPATTVLTAGASGSFNDTGDIITISSTTGLAPGDYIYLSHGTITDGAYEIATVPSGTTLTLVNNPFAGAGNQTSISYQVAWAYITTAGTAPMSSDAAGDENFLKFDAEDSEANVTQVEENFFVRNAPAGSAYISLGGQNFSGATVSSGILALAILAGWSNQGGVTHVELDDHSVQTQNDFTWTTIGGVAEQTLAVAETNGLTATAGDGIKYGRLLFKSRSNGTTMGVDFDITVDSSGPTLTLTLVGA